MRDLLSLILAALILLSISAVADSKINTRITSMGHSRQSTVYIKGARERSEGARMGMGMGPRLVTITQCDRKRIITINPQADTCLVMPLGNESGPASSPAAANEPRSKGGTITYNISIIDTGERQKMFGFTARHIKTTMNAEPSPDACSQTTIHTEIDGWYADVAPRLSCGTGITPPPPTSSGGACQDKVRVQRTGGDSPGYPLKQTSTVQAEGQTHTLVTEVVELISAPLDAALFEMPPGCRVVRSYQELMGMGGRTGGAPGRRSPIPPKPEPAAPAAPKQ